MFFGTLFRGNWIGEAPYKNGRPCSECPPSYGGGCLSNLCYKGMCKEAGILLPRLVHDLKCSSTVRTVCVPSKKIGTLLWICNTPGFRLVTITCCWRLFSACCSFTLQLKCICPHVLSPLKTRQDIRDLWLFCFF